MINFNYEIDFNLEEEEVVSKWIIDAISNEGFKLEEINYVFCDDEYLHKLNVEFLDHDTLTDVISFDYSVGKIVQGDIFISVERVIDNAKDFEVEFDSELKRVMVHGVLHYCGYKDKTESDASLMREKEEYYLNLIK
ncbi:rRNA maturation RNase YbeY [Algibacter lectus]|uniref:Endoribonuclease YbeY n=1 Tax=Algibacter lectus TaxID=221126 RepID=A0A090VBX4_9FLAO|nr:rRNA maturation RNase YbeY [Algibacter lectus]MWW24403.1 rRNA maturation RNase YbeY [Algibacter lectus]TDY62422.1 rRNA maturation RNase YbeY [Algibacter lectus]GAL62310.1 metal-dependent hydrolase YbeY [Algibacter lectus]SFC65317.1 rRNA maturation RNase YbeY [Algibacter lectus]